MSRAVTAVEAFGREIDEPITKRFQQVLHLSVTGLATDTAYDFSNAAGAFWTDALADVTYGSVATQALAVLRAIQAGAKNFLSVQSPQLAPKTVMGATIQSINGTVASGSATPAVTVTGLLTTDVILSVTQTTKGANSLPLLGWNSQVAGGITAVYSADPGASGVLQVTFLRPAGTQTPGKGQYLVSVSSSVPNLTYASGDAPTSAEIYMAWDMRDGSHPTKYPLP